MVRTFPLPYDVSSATLARRHVEQFAVDEKLDGQSEIIAVVATELVTNAILHGAQPVELSLRHELDEITVEVSDGDSSVANVRTPTSDERTTGGRGLLLIASLADHWGTKTSDIGKTVWATIDNTHI